MDLKEQIIFNQQLLHVVFLNLKDAKPFMMGVMQKRNPRQRCYFLIHKKYKPFKIKFMRKIKLSSILFTFFISAFISHNCVAQTLIAVQNESTQKFYTSLDTAITYAQEGDTVYIPGGSFTLSTSIDKSIHIIGVGHNPNSTSATGFSQILGDIILLNGSDNSSFEGLYLNGYRFSFGLNSLQDISGVIIRRCHIFYPASIPYSGAISFFDLGSQAHYQNILITENVIILSDGNGGNIANNIGIGGLCANCMVIQNIIISNNIIIIPNSAFSGISGISLNCDIKNNIILGGQYPFASLNACNVDNNIIFSNAPSSNIINCVFKNNLAGDTLENIGSSNTFINSIGNVLFNTVFINVPAQTFNYSYNFHLQSTSMGKNAGTDGSDVGIYGGAFPWKEGSIPFNPHISSKIIDTQNDANGNIRVRIKVKAQSN